MNVDRASLYAEAHRLLDEAEHILLSARAAHVAYCIKRDTNSSGLPKK